MVKVIPLAVAHVFPVLRLALHHCTCILLQDGMFVQNRINSTGSKRLFARI